MQGGQHPSASSPAVSPGSAAPLSGSAAPLSGSAQPAPGSAGPAPDTTEFVPGAVEQGRPPLRILYASGLTSNDSSMYRLWALERLGHTVLPLNAFDYRPANKLMEKVVYRLAAGPW